MSSELKQQNWKASHSARQFCWVYFVSGAYGKCSIFAANWPCCLHGVGTGLKIDRSNRR
jgi:hypothetical protein